MRRSNRSEPRRWTDARGSISARGLVPFLDTLFNLLFALLAISVASAPSSFDLLRLKLPEVEGGERSGTPAALVVEVEADGTMRPGGSDAVFRSPEDSRRHAEMLADEEERKLARSPDAPPTPAQEGVPRMKDIASYMKTVMTGAASGPAGAKFPGRLGLLHPRNARIDAVAGAWGEAVPQAWSPDRERLLFTALVDKFAQVFEPARDSGRR